jgi:hypothetical protein
MIFDLHGETLVRGIERRAFWHSPGLQDTFHLETEIVMQAGCAVPLHNKAVALALIELRRRLGRFREAPLAFVFL